MALASLFITAKVDAHAEHDKARFVATNGVDKGNCNNPVRPCKSISYAVSRAAKGDKVLVASGNYTLNNESELFYLKSQLVPVIGGFNRFDHFQVQSPDVNKTSIIGAPKALHETLHKAGFKVIADKKSMQISNTLQDRLNRNQALFKSQQQQACENGRAGAFSCNKVDLVSHVPLPSGTSGSDVWGHVDLNTNSEYAIMGYSDGTRVYHLADPNNPVLVGHVRGKNTSWRDIKVYQYYDEQLSAYQAYAYITAEENDGIQIIDLNNLPTSVSLANTNRDINTAHNVYISNLDYSLNTSLTGLAPKLQIVGADRYGGAFTSFDLTNAKTPVQSYKPSQSSRSNYTHDATSMMVDDIRASRDCINSRQGICDVFIDFNEDEIRIWDATDSSKTQRLGQVGYDDVAKSSQYVHSGWWHENKRYVYVQDEFDENTGGLNTTVRILDLADLTNPTIVGKWTSNNRTIDHNGFVKGNRYYMSNYERGLTILDISNPTAPQEVGYFDTFPSSDNPSFNGAWGAYPYLPSGNILISDINSGLYLVKDNTRQNLAQASMSSAQQSVDRGNTVTINVNKPMAVNQTATVEFQLVNGSAVLNQDYRLENTSQTLTWPANDSNAKTITINVLNTGKSKQSDFFVKLHNASSNLQLADQFIHRVNINGEASAGKVGFVKPELLISESNSEYVAHIQRVGGSKGQITVDARIDFDSANSSDVSFNTTSLTWQDGETANKQIRFRLVDDSLVEADERFTISLINADANLLSNKLLSVTIKDNDSNQAPTVYAGNNIELATNASAELNAAKVTDPEGDSLRYQWQQISGVALTLADTDKLIAKVTAGSVAGEALVRLTATDIHGATNSSELTITVVAPPSPTPAPTTPTTSNNDSSGGSMPTWLIAFASLLLCHRRLIAAKNR